MLSVAYDQGVLAEATIMMRPCTVPNDEASIRKEIERLGNALVIAARSPDGRRSFPKQARIAAPRSRQSGRSPALTCSSQSQYRPAAPTMPHATFIPQGQDASMK